MAAGTFYRVASMATLAAQAGTLGLVHVSSLASAEIAVPPLVYGAPFLERWPVRELPGGPGWQDTAYTSYSPWVFTIPDAIVHATAGIVCVGGCAIQETLAHADPARHGYTLEADGIRIDTPATQLPGTHISTLAAGAPGNYYHTLIDGLGRLAAVSDPLLTQAAGLLTTPDRSSPAAWLLDRVAERWGLLRTVALDHQSLRVERLVLAGVHDSTFNYHPTLAAWFDTRAALADRGLALPAAFYIDRRGTAARPLLNETELVEALAPLGIVPVALEHLAPREQIALFRNARLIVAPHGAGLANLVFARPGCRVIELQMNAYCNWCFRRLAALKGLAYDCIPGRAAGQWLDLAGPVHAMRWQVSVPHVLAAVRAVMAG